MKKTEFTYLIISICTGLILSIIVIGYINTQNNKNENEIQLAEKITDECTEEWDKYRASIHDIEQANSKENIVSPNAKVIFKDYFKACGHIETTEENVSEEAVNMNKEQIKERYSNYEIEKFSTDEINFYREIEGLCDKHYLLIEEEGYLAIYKLENSGDKLLVSKTNISSEYLTDADNVQLKQGIYVYGLDELNRTLEDFE